MEDNPLIQMVLSIVGAECWELGTKTKYVSYYSMPRTLKCITHTWGLGHSNHMGCVYGAGPEEPIRAQGVTHLAHSGSLDGPMSLVLLSLLVDLR